MIELIITLAIVAMVSTMGIFSWGRYKARQCAAYAATQFVQDLRYAREQALVRSTGIKVVFDINSYTIKTSDDITTIKTNGLMARYGPILSMTPESGTIAFDYRGTLDRTPVTGTTLDPPYWITFGTAPGVVRKITVMTTGFSRVEKVEG